MNRFLMLGAATLFLVACPDTGKNDSADTGDSDTDTDAVCDIYDGPILIQTNGASVTCNAETATAGVVFEVLTDGVASGGIIFTQETGDENSARQFADEHDLAVVSFDEQCETTSTLERELATGAPFGDEVTNQSTIFSCAPATHYLEPGRMSYVFSVEDMDGNTADCLIVGDRNSILTDNTTDDRTLNPSNLDDLEDCDSGVLASAY